MKSELKPEQHGQLPTDVVTTPATWIMPALLCGILLLALGLRLYGVRFGLPSLNDQDELMFEMGAVRLISGPTLNPGWFGHPATTTIYLLAVINVCVLAVGWFAGWFAGPKAFAAAIYADPSWVMLPGRLAMVGFGVLCIWLTYRLGRELFDRRVGVFAALLMAINPLHIAYSQVIRSDVMATCFMLLCMLAALRVGRAENQAERRRATRFAAFWLAIAIITKWPFALSGLAVAGCVFLGVYKGHETMANALKRLVGFGLLTIVLALLMSPYIVLDYPVLIRNLKGEAQPYHLGATGGTVLENLWWYASGPLWRSFGPAGCALLIAGAFLLRRRYEALALMLPPILALVAITVTQTLVWERWMLPLVPLFALVVAYAAMGIGHSVQFLRRPARGGIITVMTLALVWPPLQRDTVQAQERIHDTRQMASRWVLDNVPGQDTLLVEHFAFDLLPGNRQFRFPMGDAGCVDVRAMLSGRISYATIQAGRGQRSNVDYGTMNLAKRETCRSDYALLTQYDRYAAERDRFPKEYKAYRALLAQGQIVATFNPVKGRVGGPVIRVVRFQAPSDHSGSNPHELK